MFILKKSDLSLVDSLSNDDKVSGLNSELIQVVADSLEQAQQNAKSAAIEILYATVNDWIDEESGFDDKFQKRCIAWKSDSSSSVTRLSRITDLENWSDNVWTEYARIRAKYSANDFSEDFNPASIAPLPWNFWQVREV
jgi:hypothetical protein